MAVVRQVSALLLAALVTSRGLFAQVPVAADSFVAAADAARAELRQVDLRYVQPRPLLTPPAASIKALYVNAWAFGSSKLWQLVRLADETEINAFVIDVKDDTGCLLYPSAVPTAQEIGANACVRTRDVRARLDTLAAHHIYPIARFVVAKDPLLAERKPEWSVKERDTGGLWRDRIGSAWVDAYNDSVWIYTARLAQEAVRLGFQEVQFDYVRFPDEPRERLATALFPARRAGQSQREAVRAHLGLGQVWEDFATVADVVLPMVYPSHYYRGAYGFERPNTQPYRVVRSALTEALARSRPISKDR